MTNDYGLRQDQKEHYDHRGRWVLSGAFLAGWIVGATVPVSPLGVGFLLAFLSGGITLNVLKEELPEERESRFGAILAGAAGHGALLLAAG